MVKKKIVLIEPAFPNLFKGQEFFTLQPALGLLFLGAVLEKQGFDVEVINMGVQEDFDLTGSFAVGITGHAVQHRNIVRIAKKVKKQNSKLPVILGGSHATFSADFILDQVKEIDFIIRNEGEISFPLLLDNIDNSEALKKIEGLSFRENGKIINNPSEPILDLDKLPVPAFHLLKLDKHFNKIDTISEKFNIKDLTLSIGLSTSRGCPAKCNFCSARLMQHPELRLESCERVIQELKAVKKTFKPWLERLNIDFIDNTFNVSKDRVIEICRALKENKMDIKWRCFCRATAVDEDIAKEMAESGCIGVFVGAEAANDESLKKMKKGLVTSSVAKAVKHFTDNNISTIISFMVGFPWEKKKDIMQTFNTALTFQQMNPIIEAKIFKPTPFYGTDLWKLLEEQNLLKNSVRYLDKEEVDEFDISRRKGLTFRHPFLDEADIDAMIVWFSLKTAVQNIIFLTQDEYKNFEEGIRLRISLLLNIAKTLGSKERFEKSFAAIENMLSKPSEKEARKLYDELDSAIETMKEKNNKIKDKL
jgi:anaerobic magnesium-protoporphyrin IX monomethyl ester cyclase